MVSRLSRRRGYICDSRGKIYRLRSGGLWISLAPICGHCIASSSQLSMSVRGRKSPNKPTNPLMPALSQRSYSIFPRRRWSWMVAILVVGLFVFLVQAGRLAPAEHEHMSGRAELRPCKQSSPQTLSGIHYPFRCIQTNSSASAKFSHHRI